MAFQTQLPWGAALKIANSDGQTHLTFESENGNQNQGSSISSGQWTKDPTVFETSDGVVLRIEGDETHYTQIKEDVTHSLSGEPDLKGAKTLPLEKINDKDAEAPPMKPMTPMKPMAPMKPMDS